jgi:CRP-like cAMP-binding protein
MPATSPLAELYGRYSAPRELRAGRALVYQGDAAEAAWLVETGRLRRIRLHGERSQAIGESGSGSWLCLAELYLDLPCLADIVALERVTLRRFSRFNFFELLREPAFKDLVLKELALGLYALHDSLMPSGADEVVARAVAAQAAAACGGQRGTLRATLTQSGLAEATGFTRETVNRSLRRLEAQGFLETGRGEILVYDLEGLRRYEG